MEGDTRQDPLSSERKEEETQAKACSASRIIRTGSNPTRPEAEFSIDKKRVMFSKHFTPKEANQLLPAVRPIVAEILSKGGKLRNLLEEDPNATEGERGGQLQEEISLLMMELEDMGCFFKDWNFEIGLVDFPAIIDGEEALLCWRSDEAEILWYHDLEDGYAGRRPLPEYWLLDMDHFKEQ